MDSLNDFCKHVGDYCAHDLIFLDQVRRFITTMKHQRKHEDEWEDMWTQLHEVTPELLDRAGVSKT